MDDAEGKLDLQSTCMLFALTGCDFDLPKGKSAHNRETTVFGYFLIIG